MITDDDIDPIGISRRCVLGGLGAIGVASPGAGLVDFVSRHAAADQRPLSTAARGGNHTIPILESVQRVIEMTHTLPLQFGLPGGPELLIILFIAVLLFGANKLPALARSSGQAMGEFKRGRQELEDELTKGVESGHEKSEDAPDVGVDGQGDGERDNVDGHVEAEPTS